jgi:hypothetical protein
MRRLLAVAVRFVDNRGGTAPMRNDSQLRVAHVRYDGALDPRGASRVVPCLCMCVLRTPGDPDHRLGFPLLFRLAPRTRHTRG